MTSGIVTFIDAKLLKVISQSSIIINDENMPYLHFIFYQVFNGRFM
jgi:hypothetical protein